MKKKIAKIVVLLIMLICIGLLGYSGYQIYLWHQDNKKIDEQVAEIEEKVDVEEKEDSENTEIVEVKPPVNKFDPYYDYIKMNLIDVNFNELLKINKDVVGWIQVAGTTVNYPFVQTTNNDYYLTHQLNKKYNAAGWVFMDYRNSKNDFDKNTIIYAHGRLNNAMFGSLRNVIKSSWYNNPSNYVVKMSTPYENTLWQVFSTYKIKTTNDYLQIDFSSDESYLNFLDMLTKRSVHDYGVTLSADDKIISLSTCYNDEEKIVLHARMIKREKKQ